MPIPRYQRGTAAIEVAFGILPFFIMVLGLMELARVMFVWNTLTESTRRVARAASVNYYTAATSNVIRAAALFDNTGKLPIGGGIGRDNLKVDYLTSGLVPASLPPCPTLNIINCNANPDGANCVRFVRVSICQADGAAGCTPVPYAPVLAPGWLFPWSINIPSFATVRPVGSLGYVAGVTDSCP